ncbi:WD40 repeat-like protein [Auriscalpium vulgare]|uniref:WD40 repeat-like protein n=1 Tax=Auriscalpium vulgare TaxID=40419 RepID=A0ACB8SC51_9AGAM|nr:WD40 repeat-like protein [Auriscalpium vulgare]
MASSPPPSQTPPTILHTLQVPSPVSALEFTPAGSLLVGSDDGTLRIYDLPDTKVLKAVRKLGAEISSVACVGDTGHLWLAGGRRIFLVDIGLPKILQSAEDALGSLELGEDDDDVVNEISLSFNRKVLAFSTDGGTVGVVDLASRKVQRMKARHDSICGAVRFIPDRPSELVSGGYDSALLHFDFQQRNILSRYHFSSPHQSSGVSLSPPFVLSLAVSPSGVIAAGTADGHLWIGMGGAKKASGSKKKRSRKWEGLREDEGNTIKIAEGPVVCVLFTDSSTIITSTLLGTVTQFSLSGGDEVDLAPKSEWVIEVAGIAKVNALAALPGRVVVGGFNKDGRGIVEVYQTNVVVSAGTQ